MTSTANTLPETTTALCSCGCTKPHVFARRETADEAVLCLWTDGSITQGHFGAVLAGLGRPRGRYTQRRRAAAVRLVADAIGMFDRVEIPALVRAAEDTFKHTWSSEDARRQAAIRAASRA